MQSSVDAAQTYISRLLGAMASWKASDLFLTEGKPPAARVNGEVRSIKQPPLSQSDMQDFLQAILLPTAQEEFRRNGDLDVGFSLGEDLRFRLNLSRQKGQLHIVARALPSGALDIDRLGLPNTIKGFSDLARGLVLVTGATGSGKSTTLAAIIHRINTQRRVHVVTIEDPIEFIHKDLKSRISQREVGSDTESFSSALKHVVRQSPDVILIGEMRDLETMRVALSAALTGHLVFATLHTIDATQTLQRILSYYPQHLRSQAAMDLSLSVQGIISQRLIPDITGTKRVVAAEVMTSNPAVVRLIREQRVDELEDLMKASSDPGMVTFNRSLLRLFQDGKINFEMGRSYATNPEEFALGVKGMKTGTGSFMEDESAKRLTGMDMKSLLGLTLERGASDLHIATGRKPIIRLDGELEPLLDEVLGAGDIRALLNSILTNRQRESYQLERELDFALSLENGQRFRVNAYFQKGNMAAAFRTISTTIPQAKSLGLPPALLDLAHAPHGLVLVVGPTGSGKSTTLACMIDQINHNRKCRIITVEDPIEYVHTSDLATIDQRELYADTKSFASALKYVLRQDPDVILVGEMRDLETIHAALTAAETGHLVFGTLHTNDAIQAIDRVIDVFPSHQQSQVRTQLAASLLAVVSQRLLQRNMGDGRIAAFELMIGTPAIRNVIRENKMHQALSLMETGSRAGMITMDKCLLTLMERRQISREEATRYMKNPNSLPPLPVEGTPEHNGGRRR